jgi:hypothetical protein
MTFYVESTSTFQSLGLGLIPRNKQWGCVKVLPASTCRHAGSRPNG